MVLQLPCRLLEAELQKLLKPLLETFSERDLIHLFDNLPGLSQLRHSDSSSSEVWTPGSVRMTNRVRIGSLWDAKRMAS